MSADGNKLIATSQSRLIFTNGGWEIATDGKGPIYASTDGGTTWSMTAAPINDWLPGSIACSADGNKVYAPTGSGEVWMYQSTPSPELNLTATSSNLLVSWIIPAQNMVFQKSTDLLSWLTITNVPVLNLSNLKNQVTLPFSGAGGFFRLSTP